MRPSGSVVIAAYDEEAVIGRCLEHLLDGFEDGELEVVVVANGCSDRTAEAARAFPVRVVEVAEASKPAALRAGDRAATAFPRIYLDADVLLSSAAARCVLAHLDRADAHAARPRFRYDTHGCSLLVRSYYRARGALPSMTGNLWGAGVYALSERGRTRFAAFPDVTGDDLFVDQQFAREEIAVLDCAPVVVLTARSSRALLQVLRRQQRGKRQLGRAAEHGAVSGVYRDLAALAGHGPRSAADAVVFAVLAGLSRSRPLRKPVRWERDASSRRPSPSMPLH